MKRLNYFLTGAVCIALCACGGKKSVDSNWDEEDSYSEYLTPSTTNVSGSLGSDFKVVDRKYKVSDDMSKIITVELERTDSPLPFDTEDYTICSFDTYMSSANIQVGFGIEFLDDEGNILDKTNASDGGYSHSEAVELVNLEPGETGSIRFRIDYEGRKATQFRITSTYKVNEGRSSSSSISSYDDEDNSSDDEDVSSSNSSSSKNWDDILNSYEQYVDKYISCMKKVANGDMAAMSEYQSLLEKAEEFGDQLDSAQSDMTSAQLSRYMKITQKMMSAAQSMY